MKRLSFNNVDDLYAAIGYGGVTATRVANRLRDELARSSKTDKKTALDKVAEAAERREQKAAKEGKAIHGILVQGIDNCLVKFSRCYPRAGGRYRRLHHPRSGRVDTPLRLRELPAQSRAS
ncbi:MAG: hypothetical protein V8S72_00315 [Oscillospiraceae bacterium]